MAHEADCTRILVIGAGFSGTMVAAHLLHRDIGRALEITLVNRSGPVARGLAYGTRSDVHVLNVPAGRMGALADDEGGFLRFVRQSHPDVDGGAFVPRRWYGDYLESLLADAERQAPASTRLTRVVGEALGATPDRDGHLDLALRDGRRIRADRIVLALGNYAPTDPRLPDMRLYDSAAYVRDPWTPGALAAIPTDRPTLLIGTGLTMADVALTLGARDTHQPIYVLSRRGLLPQAHRSPSHAPTERHVPPDLLTGPATARGYLRSVRRHVRAIEAEGLDWREVIGSIRADTPALWKALDVTERARFLRHVRPYWEVHRHRCAPQIATALRDLMNDGRLVPLAGRLVRGEATPDGACVEIRMRGDGQRRTLTVGGIVNCTGPDGDVRRLEEPLIRSLVDQGLLRGDALGLGIETDADYRIQGTNGHTSPLYYVGPLLKSTHWESTAVPELREHAARAADAIVRSLG